MRINIHAVAATIQLSSLPFASANHCWKDLDDYGCGAGYQENGYFNIDPDTNECICCCEQEDGGGYHRDTCDGWKGNIKSLDKGCGSCMGKHACKDVSNSKIGDKSCVNNKSCLQMTDSFIKEYSCRSRFACYLMAKTHVGTNSCGIGHYKEKACQGIFESTIGDNSCQAGNSCYAYMVDTWEYVTIGNNACNKNNICEDCENYSVVPDGACNGDKDDYQFVDNGPDFGDRCNYCFSAYHSTTSTAQYTATSTSGGRRLNNEDLNNACKDLANKLLNYTDVSIQDYPAFRNFVSESITDTCNNGGTFSNRFDFITDSDKGTCTIKIDRLSNMRLKNGDEISAKDYIGLKVAEYDLEPIEGFTRDYLNATDLVIEKYCDNGGSKSSKSSITTNVNGAKSGKDGKSSQAVLKKRHREREPKSKKD